jgi:hypothetical protein
MRALEHALQRGREELVHENPVRYHPKAGGSYRWSTVKALSAGGSVASYVPRTNPSMTLAEALASFD